RKRELFRIAIAHWRGYEVDYEGDGFLVAFQRAADAVEMATEAQQLLACEPWPEGRGVRVRIGIPTGEPLLDPPKYVGTDGHRAARIMVVAYGGQVLVSKAVFELLIDGGFEFTDLGEHLLKDMPRPLRVSQLQIAGLQARFPPLGSIDSRPNNLP